MLKTEKIRDILNLKVGVIIASFGINVFDFGAKGDGITFHDCSHLSRIYHIVAQNNTVILSTTTVDLFGMEKGPCNVKIDTLNFEYGVDWKPTVSRLKYGVYDPESRLHGSICWHKPWGKQGFPAVCGDGFKIKQF